jgi:hypothetical protein
MAILLLAMPLLVAVDSKEELNERISSPSRSDKLRGLGNTAFAPSLIKREISRAPSSPVRPMMTPL